MAFKSLLLACTLLEAAKAAPIDREQLEASPPPPHIVVITIDDWGYNNWGAHSVNNSNSKEILTPHIDSLANEGVELMRFYVHQVSRR